MAEFNYSQVENILGISLKNKSLLTQAFTHSSYANENKVKSNERLEFLGDSVLGLVVTKKIFKETKLKEGDLSKLRALIVSEDPLARVIDGLDIEKFMLKGKGESKNTVSSKAIKCDLFEAIVGAIYLDKGYDAAEKFVLNKLKQIIDQSLKLKDFEDEKTRLQETFFKDKIIYESKKGGDDYNPYYTTKVYINGKVCGSGKASNKRTSERLAAKQALEKIKKV